MDVLNFKLNENVQTYDIIFLLSFIRLIDLVHQDLLLADQFSKLKVNVI